MTMRAAIYARVSDRQQRDRHTIENQLRELPAFVASRGWELVDTYVDDGRSAKTGKLDAREGFARLVRDADARRFDLLVVVDVDRLTRTNSMEERAQILGPFQRNGIRIVTPAGGEQDLETMFGQLWVTLQALSAAQENLRRSDRAKAGKLRAIAEGRMPGGHTPFGFTYSSSARVWSIDAAAAALVREIYDRVINGESCRAIADDFARRGIIRARGGRWHRERVWRVVTSRMYLGEWTADRDRNLVVPVPPIVGEETWHAAQVALMRHRRRGIRRVKHIYLLEDLARCGACGARVGIRTTVSRGPLGRIKPGTYVCGHRRRPPDGQRPCQAPCVAVADIDARIWAAVEREVSEPELLEHVIELERRHAGEEQDWAADARSARQRLDRLSRLVADVLRRVRDDLVSQADADAELLELRRQRKMAERQLAAAARAKDGLGAAGARLGELQAAIAGLRDRVSQALPEERQRLFRALVVPGSVVMVGRQVRFTLMFESSAATEPASPRGTPSLVVQRDEAACRSAALASVKVQLVA